MRHRVVVVRHLAACLVLVCRNLEAGGPWAAGGVLAAGLATERKDVLAGPGATWFAASERRSDTARRQAAGAPWEAGVGDAAASVTAGRGPDVAGSVGVAGSQARSLRQTGDE
jgi:hypothetical protein